MDKLRAGKPMVVGDVTLVAIERCFVQSDTGDMGCWLSGLKEPFAIIVSDASGIRAFDATGIDIPVPSLVRQIPALDPLLTPLSP